jgi:dienelactone hydrolase
VRPRLRQAIGFTDLPGAELAPRLIERVDKGDYVREKILLRTSRDSAMPVYVLVPKQVSQPAPTVVAFHGHGYGVRDIVGLWNDGSERDTPDGYHKDFGVELCRRGFVVAAPEISCFGERQTDFSYLNGHLGQGAPSTCVHTAMLSFHLGGSVVGLRAHDGERLLDYLETRADVDVARIGAMGISGGGMHTFFTTCLDPRIKAAVVSGYYCTFRDSILAMHHCPCNFVPGLAAFGEMHDLVGLIAPRPLLVEAGTHDGIFPIRAVRSSVARARKVYDVFAAREQVATDYFEGRHQISGAKAYDFLWGHLSP